MASIACSDVATMPVGRVGQDASRNVRTVLVVDDDRAIREMLVVALEVEGYRVWALDDGRNVVGTLLSASGPCVVLLDLMMPYVSGWEVCRALAADARLAGHPVAVMTAGMVPGDACPLPALALLRKPFELDQVYAVVARLADEAAQAGPRDAWAAAPRRGERHVAVGAR